MDTLNELKGATAAGTKEILAFVNSFIDAKSLVEVDAYMRSDTDLGQAIGEGVISGFASVGGQSVDIFALNESVLKGSIGKKNSIKIVKSIDNALRTMRPLIGVIDTMGARFNEGIAALEGYGRIIKAYTEAYGSVPIITVIKGSNLGILSYISGLSDFVIVYNDSISATASPLVLSAQSGKEVNKIGSGSVMMNNGIATNIVKDDKELKATLLKILSIINNSAKSADDSNRVCKGLKSGVAVETLIKEVFDKDSFFEVRKGYATAAVTGFASAGGIDVGVVATSSAKGAKLTANDCIKIYTFLDLCENLNRDVVFLTDCSGTEQNIESETFLMREMSNLLYSINTLSVDTVSIVYGKAIGVSYSAFVAPSTYRVAWESAFISPLDGDNAARLAYSEEIGKAKGKQKDELVKKLSAAYITENCSAVKLSQDGYIDNVIDPNHTRQYLIAALQAVLGC